MSRTTFHSPKDVRAIEVRLYTEKQEQQNMHKIPFRLNPDLKFALRKHAYSNI